MTILGVESVVFGVSDLAEHTRFWTDFGLPLESSDGYGSIFRLASGSRVVLRPHGHADLPSPDPFPGDGVKLTVWGVDTAANLERIAASLASEVPVTRRADGTVHAVCPDGQPIALRLWDKPEGIEGLPEFAAVSEELQVFAETLARPYCGSTAGFGTASWFGEHASHIRSQALIALRNGGGTIGMIALGSEDAHRFFAEMGTLYLERLGEMVSAALARVTKSVL